MPKCPYCGADVRKLFLEKKILYAVKLADGQLIYTEKGRETLYMCPNCWRVIAMSEAEAEKFLSTQRTDSEA
jgi:DNA-directed RNA polymerase subunit RPC12/RpoP